MSVVKNLMIRAGADFSEVRAEFDSAAKRIKSFQKTATTSMGSTKKDISEASSKFSGFSSNAVKAVAKITAAVVALKVVGQAIKQSVGYAVEFESSVYQISRLMGDNANAFESWAKTQASAYGMSQAAAMKYGAVYSNLISGFSSGTTETTERTEQLLKASAIVASATGRTMEDTMDRIRSGLLGNTEAIEDLGINVNVAMIESTEAFKKFAGGRSWQQLDFNTQQQIRLMAILEQANKKYGDTLAATTATSQMQFLATLDNIKLSLGQAFLPIYNAVLPALNSMATGLANAVNSFSQFMQVLFGYKQPKASVKATEDQAGAVTELGDAYEGAGKAAQNSLASFDEINKLGEASSSGSAGGSSVTAPASPAVGEATQDMSAIEDAVEKFKSVFDFTNLKASWKEFYDALKPISQDVLDSLNWLKVNILVPFSEWTIEEALPKFLEALASVLETLGIVIGIFKPMFEFIWDKFLQPLAKFVGGMIIQWLSDFSTGTTDIGTAIENTKAKLSILLGALGLIAVALGAIPAAIALVILAFATLMSDWDTFSAQFTYGWYRFWVGLGNVLISISEFMIHTFAEFINTLIDMVNTTLDKLNLGKFKIKWQMSMDVLPRWKMPTDVLVAMSKLELGNVNSNGIGGGASQYASGGFPSVGELFIANEAGPELVGTIGGSNAVVNNDQIVSSVSKGVYDAVKSAMGGKNGDTIVVKIGDRTIYESIVSEMKRKNARAGYNVATVVT